MIKWKIDLFLVAIIIVGIATFAFKCKITYPIKWIGDGTDSAIYAEMADSQKFHVLWMVELF